jgi:hypothetical protein
VVRRDLHQRRVHVLPRGEVCASVSVVNAAWLCA